MFTQMAWSLCHLLNWLWRNWAKHCAFKSASRDVVGFFFNFLKLWADCGSDSETPIVPDRTCWRHTLFCQVILLLLKPLNFEVFVKRLLYRTDVQEEWASKMLLPESTRAFGAFFPCIKSLRNLTPAANFLTQSGRWYAKQTLWDIITVMFRLINLMNDFCRAMLGHQQVNNQKHLDGKVYKKQFIYRLSAGIGCGEMVLAEWWGTLWLTL